MPKIFNDHELKQVWNLYRTGYMRRHIAEMLGKTPEEITQMQEAGQRRWGKGPRANTAPVSQPKTKSKND